MSPSASLRRANLKEPSLGQPSWALANRQGLRSSGARHALFVAMIASLGCGDNIGATVDSGAPGLDAAVDAADAANLPDLMIAIARAEIDLAIGERDFATDACEIDPEEACIGGTGTRRLLYFSVETPNIGDVDMVLGMPSPDNEAFDYSACHDHFHFDGYAAYELLDSSGTSIAVGRKQAFCLLDSGIFLEDDPTVSPDRRYDCNFQGIQRGWSDVYDARLPCQFLDITDVIDGNYMLRVELNRERGLEESNYDNNTALIPITIGDAALTAPTEPCASDGSPRDQGTNRECGWRSDEVFACNPGTTVSIGCSQHCGAFSIGECTGDPMVRVCDATRSDGNCSSPSAVGLNDNACGASCPVAFDFECPASGMLEVFTAARIPGEAYSCSLEVFE